MEEASERQNCQALGLPPSRVSALCPRLPCSQCKVHLASEGRGVRKLSPGKGQGLQGPCSCRGGEPHFCRVLVL